VCGGEVRKQNKKRAAEVRGFLYDCESNLVLPRFLFTNHKGVKWAGDEQSRKKKKRAVHVLGPRRCHTTNHHTTIHNTQHKRQNAI
jgi:hypothetical protein